MGREIHYRLKSPRPFSPAEMLAGEQVVLTFNRLFRDHLGYGLLNFGESPGRTNGEQFFDRADAYGDTKPYGEVNALFLYGGLVALSRVLPSATISVSDEGDDDVYTVVEGGVELQNGSVCLLGDRGAKSGPYDAARAVCANHWISEINEGLPGWAKKLRKSRRGVLRSSQVAALLSEIFRLVSEDFARRAPAKGSPNTVGSSEKLRDVASDLKVLAIRALDAARAKGAMDPVWADCSNGEPRIIDRNTGASYRVEVKIRRVSFL